MSIRRLSKNEIRIWQVDINLDCSDVKADFDSLTPAEKEKAARFHRREDRLRFAVTRSALREILGGYVGISPDRIEFSETDRGKPFMVGPVQPISFNVSHSGSIALVAIAQAAVGIDVEEIKAEFDFESVCQVAFSVAECRELFNVPEDQRVGAFYKKWTRKEAYLKCLGLGMGAALPTATVEEQTANRRGFLTSIDMGDDYAAAVAFENSCSRILFHCMKFDESTKQFHSTEAEQIFPIPEE